MAAAELAGLTAVRTCPEPVAAAHHYAAHHSVAVGDRMCIYDLGGGTFDVCVLVKTDDGFEILGKPTGIPFLGGADFDQLIISAVVEGLSALNCDVEPDDPGSRHCGESVWMPRRRSRRMWKRPFLSTPGFVDDLPHHS